MTCKYCSRELPDDAIFCCYCGERVARKRREKKTEVSVPDPKQLPSGTWFVQVMVDGKRVSISAPTEKECREKARATKAGLIEVKKKAGGTLRKAMRDYIDSVEPVLPPSTIRGYEVIYRNRLPKYMDKDIDAINFQNAINEEAKHYAPKTVSNTWGLVSLTLKSKGLRPPEVSLPTVVPYEGDFLDYAQIQKFLAAIRDDEAELAAILALHSLRQSELLDLDASALYDNTIHVRGATVQDKHNVYVHKEANKNSTSRRDVPVLIPRLTELWPSQGRVVTAPPNTIMAHVKAACKAAGIPECSLHDLRRSFASLAYHLNWKDQTTMLVGGWKNMKTVNAVYKKLAAPDQQEDIEKMRTYYREIASELRVDCSEIANEIANESQKASNHAAFNDSK